MTFHCKGWFAIDHKLDETGEQGDCGTEQSGNRNARQNVRALEQHIEEVGDGDDRRRMGNRAWAR